MPSPPPPPTLDSPARERIRKWRGRWGVQRRCGRGRGHAPRIRVRVWGLALASFARMAAWRDIAGDYRGRSNCWRRNGLRVESRSRIARRYYWRGFTRVAFLGQSGLNLDSPIFRFFIMLEYLKRK